MYQDNPFMNHLQYQHYPDMEQEQIATDYNAVPDNNAASDTYFNQTFPGMDVKQYSQPFVSVPKKADPDAPTQTEIHDQQVANQVTGTVNAVGSAIPVYGQILGVATAASGAGRGLLKKDEYGKPKGDFGQFLDAEMTPVHEQVIDDIAKKKYGDAVADTLTGGQYKAVTKWFD